VGYEFLEHTADVMVEAHGGSLEEAFCFAAKAMFDTMVDLSKVVPKSRVNVEVSASDVEGLLYLWLEELLFRFDVERMVFSEFRFQFIEKEDALIGRGIAEGEPYDPKKHLGKTEVKAVTYEEMLIVKSDRGFKVRFILDI